jgi:hypothetical protein
VPETSTQRSRWHPKLTTWNQQNQQLWQRTQQHVVGHPRNPVNDIPLYLQGYEQSVDIDMLEQVRATMIWCLDKLIIILDSNNVTRSLFQKRISKIQNLQLATLLNEFQQVKDIAPNTVAISFRTIRMLTIQQRAQQIAPTSKLATGQDLKLSRIIDDAIKENVFSSGNTERLKTFRTSQQKVNYNIIAHKVGDSTLIDKAILEDATDLINNLLAEIV